MTITAMIYPLIIGPYPFNNSFIHRFTLFIFSFFSLSSPPPSSLYLPLSLSTSLFSSVLSRPSSCSSLFLSSPLSPSLPHSLHLFPLFQVNERQQQLGLNIRSSLALSLSSSSFTSISPFFSLSCSPHFHMLKHSRLILAALPSSSSSSSSSFSLALLSSEF